MCIACALINTAQSSTPKGLSSYPECTSYVSGDMVEQFSLVRFVGIRTGPTYALPLKIWLGCFYFWLYLFLQPYQCNSTHIPFCT
ncbi:hypothetical protein GDO86_008785 [Hymenochirus boettgeri]|uniref:Uncharacterized protein n=1 Tax=Hymenochirus boettgeri TaxID=247094 RepID=A0A8T2J334_9PIPI|nr:hypothetical protein GDO86_008785 [Hymenochirus boettgeri]